jgi:hypothetical protein
MNELYSRHRASLISIGLALGILMNLLLTRPAVQAGTLDAVKCQIATLSVLDASIPTQISSANKVFAACSSHTCTIATRACVAAGYAARFEQSQLPSLRNEMT